MINCGAIHHQTREEGIDPFLQGYSPRDIRTASEVLSDWLPFLSKGLCDHCFRSISDRVRSLHPVNVAVDYDTKQPDMDDGIRVSTPNRSDLIGCSDNQHSHDSEDTNSLGSRKDDGDGASEQIPETLETERVRSPERVEYPRPRMSWADMALEDNGEEEELSRQLGNSSGQDAGGIANATLKPKLSREQRELIRFTNVKRNKDFVFFERVNGKLVNILGGLELHAGVFSAVEQKRIVDFVYELQEMGKNGKLKERTYTAPQKWMRGKGRVTIQFGCCYNYVMDRNRNPPGILRNELVDPIPHLFKVMIKRLIRWHVLPPSCVPDSCIVNIYDEGDCIPPHIDNHEFVRPFCTVSFLSECNILFGRSLKIEGPGEFSGAIAIPLPVGSVLVLNGNGADVAKHCVPAVPTKRISITFRKMDESKWPVGFVPEADLQGLEPLAYEDDKPKGGSKPRPSYHYHHRQVVPEPEPAPAYEDDKPNLYKPRPSYHHHYRQAVKRENTRGFVGSGPRFYRQTRRQAPPNPGNRRRSWLEN